MMQLYGPMQSWGEIAVGQVRGSAGHPTRSAVLGMVAAALGIRRDEERRQRDLHENLGLAVRIDVPGRPLRDYHTSQVPGARKGVAHATRTRELAEPKVNTILSTRDYLADALFTVALWSRGQADLDAIYRALRRPVFYLCLGRVSCPPALPPAPAPPFEADDLEAAFARVTFPEILAALDRNRPTDADFYYDDGSPVADGVEIGRAPRMDVPLSTAYRRFARRVEIHGRGTSAKTEAKE